LGVVSQLDVMNLFSKLGKLVCSLILQFSSKGEFQATVREKPIHTFFSISIGYKREECAEVVFKEAKAPVIMPELESGTISWLELCEIVDKLSQRRGRHLAKSSLARNGSLLID
jgi:hypothetical protein